MPEDFDQPIKFTEILVALEEKGKYALAKSILNDFLLKSRFSTENRGHFPLGIQSEKGDGYLEIKPREYMGIATQHILSKIFSGGVGLTPEELSNLADHRNRKRREEPFVGYRLRFIERIANSLPLVGQVFQGRVMEEQGNQYLIEVAGFSRWGRVKRTEDFEKRHAGEVINVKLDGYRVSKRRFQFSETSAQSVEEVV